MLKAPEENVDARLSIYIYIYQRVFVGDEWNHCPFYDGFGVQIKNDGFGVQVKKRFPLLKVSQV